MSEATVTVAAASVTAKTVILVDGEERTVDSVTPVVDGTVFIDFESYDREPDGSPTAYLSREFSATEPLAVVADPQA